MKQVRTGMVGTALALLTAFGCGSSASSGGSGAPAPAVDAGIDSAREITVSGQVLVTELTMWTMGMQMPSISAAFGPITASPGNVSGSTPIASEGPCGVYYAAPATPAAKTLDAGPLTLQGGLHDVHLTTSPKGYAADLPDTAKSIFPPGAKLSLDAAGGSDIGAFHVEVAAPTKLAPTQPDFAAGLNLSVATPFDLAWPKGTSGSIFVEVVAQGTDPVTGKAASVTVSCAAADDGKLRIPASLLAHLPRTSNGMIMLTRFTSATTTVGNAQVELHVESTACSMGSIRD